MGYSFRLVAMVLLYVSSHRQNNTYTAFVTPVMEHWLEREISQWVHHEGSIRPNGEAFVFKFLILVDLLNVDNN